MYTLTRILNYIKSRKDPTTSLRYDKIHNLGRAPRDADEWQPSVNCLDNAHVEITAFCFGCKEAEINKSNNNFQNFASVCCRWIIM